MVQGYADEDHRVKTAARVHEGQLRHVKLGHHVGGRCFGYRTRHVYAGEDPNGNPLYSHAVREVDPAEARVIVRIFEMYAGGLGLKRIAATLNRERIASPKYSPRSESLNAWSATTVRAVLGRTAYRGETTWNAKRKRDEWGKKRITPRPAADLERVPAPALRIVDDDLWNRVASRRAEAGAATTSQGSPRNTGRPSRRVPNLLSGISSCALCGGGLTVLGDRYRCARRRQTGSCENRMGLPVEETNARVLAAVEAHVLRPGVVEEFLAAVEQDDTASDRRAALEKEGADVERRLARVATAIEDGGDVPALVGRAEEPGAEAPREHHCTRAHGG